MKICQLKWLDLWRLQVEVCEKKRWRRGGAHVCTRWREREYASMLNSYNEPMVCTIRKGGSLYIGPQENFPIDRPWP